MTELGRHDVITVIQWPEGTAAINLHNLVMNTDVPVIVEVLGRRYRLTDWNEQYQVFTAVNADD